jgi:hypothetical protein
MSPDQINQSVPLQKTLLNHSRVEESGTHPAPHEPISPLGWSIFARLLAAAVAAGLLWLAVAWSLAWLP